MGKNKTKNEFQVNRRRKRRGLKPLSAHRVNVFSAVALGDKVFQSASVKSKSPSPEKTDGATDRF